MGDSTTENDASRKIHALLEPQQAIFDMRLSIFGRIAVDADQKMGRRPRFHDGMTLEDAVVITGLPREEAARRIQAMKTDDNPKLYSERWLSEGVGEHYLAAQASNAEKPKQPDKTNLAEKNKDSQVSLITPDKTRPISNDMARGALFSCIQPKNRQLFHITKVGSFGDAEMFWTGMQLDQDDHDTLMQLIKSAEHKPWGEYIILPWRTLLGELGRTAGGKQQKELSNSIQRLVRGTIDFRSKAFNYTGHLVDDVKEEQQNKHLIYRLNPSLSGFYEKARFTLVDWDNRKKLKGKYLARWLQLEVSTHASPFPRSVKYYFEHSGSRATLKVFRRQLRIALGELIENGDILPTSHVDPKTDLVHVHRVPNAAQIRHIARSENGGNAPSQLSSEPATQHVSTTPRGSFLKPVTIEKFRKLYPRLDPYGCKANFDAFLEDKEAPRSYDAAFLGFAKKWSESQR